jgi:hypothetical protein
MQQEARDRAQLMATLKAAQSNNDEVDDDADAFDTQKVAKVNMFIEFRPPRRK